MLLACVLCVAQACAAAGLSLSEIGAVMSRPLVGIEEEPSELERICLRVREARFRVAFTATRCNFQVDPNLFPNLALYPPSSTWPLGWHGRSRYCSKRNLRCA